jgi:hypothetical protein
MIPMQRFIQSSMGIRVSQMTDRKDVYVYETRNVSCSLDRQLCMSSSMIIFTGMFLDFNITIFVPLMVLSMLIGIGIN